MALGFSGGVDSAYLLYAGLSLGADVRPYFVKTPFQPQFELDDARRLADQLHVPLTVLPVDILANDAVRANPSDRCYHCKAAIFGALSQAAGRDGFTVLLDGSNASDDEGDRPGMRALRELSVLSPLREAGLTKAEIRSLSHGAGLFTWDKPAYACLATRVPTGREITAPLLEAVEAAEGALHALGYSDLRVRVLGDMARLELPQDQIEQAGRDRAAIAEALRPYFSRVLLDLSGRGER